MSTYADILIRSLSSGDEDIRMWSAKCLGHTKEEKAFSALMEAAEKEKIPAVKIEMLQAIEEIVKAYYQ
jgi:HEAT repeat protein